MILNKRVRYMNLKMSRVLQVMVISIMISSLFLGSSNSFVFAALLQPQPTSPPQTIFFTNVSVDSAPTPNKPFKITADILTQNPNDLIVSISAPVGISVLSPVVAKTEYTSGGTLRASWTLTAGQPGTYSITVQAHANFPVQDVSYVVNVNVGTPNSVVITGIKVPGNIFPNDIFTVSFSLKNVGLVDDNNVLTSLSVPDGLQLVSYAGENSSSLKVNEERTFDWKLKALSSGSYAISFSYSSTNAGSNSIDSTVNVGQLQIPDITLKEVSWKGFNSTALVVGPSDQFVPLSANVQNVGNQNLFNINVELVMAKPFLSDSSGATANYVATKNYYIGRLNVGASQEATYYVNIQKNIATGIYPVDFKVDFSNGKTNSSKTFELPILISDTGFKFNSVAIKPSSVYGGDVGDQITIQIFNSGLPANDVTATLLLPPGLSAAWGNSTSFNIGRIDTFQSVPATFFVNVANVTQGALPYSLILKHNGETTKFDLNFLVSPKANFKLISVDDSQISPNAAGVPFRVTLKNVGTATAQPLTTKLLSGNTLAGVKSSTSISVGNQENLGTILPGQSFTTTFMVDVDPNVSGEQSTSVEIDWGQNNTGNFVQTLVVPYHASSSPYTITYGGIPWVYVGIGIAVMVVISVFISKRKKRKQFMDFTEMQLRDESSLDRKNALGDESSLDRNDALG
jgi:hypothetical protein